MPNSGFDSFPMILDLSGAWSTFTITKNNRGHGVTQEMFFGHTKYTPLKTICFFYN